MLFFRFVATTATSAPIPRRSTRMTKGTAINEQAKAQTQTTLKGFFAPIASNLTAPKTDNYGIAKAITELNREERKKEKAKEKATGEPKEKSTRGRKKKTPAVALEA